ncbi:MAG: hypothetical protein Q9M39_02675 [Sulfurovum sp.]|nr:hypothetical protein [Sulfurovum sp.]
MTKKELSINIKWDEFEMGTCRVFVETLNQYIPTLFFQDHKPKPTVSNTMLKAVNDILDMNKDEFDRLKEILNTQEYKIKEIHIDQDNDVFEGIYSEVMVSTDTSQQVSVIIKDGTFLLINDGTYFDTLVVGPKKEEKVYVPTKEEREKMVAILLSS